MKRKLTFMAGLAALAMLFVACSNLDEDVGAKASQESSTASRNGSFVTLNLSLTDASFDIARNVYPGDWTNGSKADLANDLANKLVWVLTGYTVANERVTEVGSDSSDFIDPDTPSNKYIILNYQDLMNGTAQVKLKPLIWYFTLTAYGTLEADPTDGAKNKTLSLTPDADGKIDSTDVCLVGTMHADMTGGENKITFNMLPPVYVIDEVTKKYTISTDAIGTAKYAVSFTPPDSFWYMKYAFYPEDEDTLDTPKYDDPAKDAISTNDAQAYFVKKLGTDPTSDPVTLVEAAYTAPASAGALPTVTAKTSDPKTYATAASGVNGYALTYKMFDTDESTGAKTGITHYLKAGKYWFRAEFYDTNNKRLLMHTEKFVIDGINTSEDEVQLNYKTFSSAPQNIEELSLQYKYNDVSFDEDPVSLYAAHCARNSSAGAADDAKYPDTYTATLTWEDVADNEIGYELWLRTWDGSAYTEEVFTPEDLGDSNSVANTTYKIKSLAAGINTTSIDLKTGVKYEIRLRAFNDRSVAQNGTGTGAYGTVWGTYALKAKEAGYDYFVPYIPRKADYDDTDATALEASDINFGLFTIDYNLNGGKIKQTSAKVSTKLHYTIPYIYKESVNKLVDTSEFPYIDRAGYDFIGWNELYGNAGVAIDGAVAAGATSNNKAGTADKYYYTHPNYGEQTFVAEHQATIPDGAALSLDSIVMNNNAALTKAEVMKVGTTSNVIVTGSLATYTWTVTLNAESTEYEGHVVSEVTSEGGTKKYIYSNLLQAGSDIPADSCENRELYASWETPLSMSIKLPAYPSFKLTKIAAAGDPIEYAISSDSDANVLELKASDKLSDLVFSIYYDDATNADASTVFENVITSIDAKGTGTSDSTAKTTTYTSTDTKATLVVPYTEDGDGNTVPGTGGTFTWNYNGKAAGVYILKVSGTYTYGLSKTNSLEKQKDVVEGYIYIRLTN